MERLYRATSPAVYAFALSVVKNTHDAQDVLQDTYLKICGGVAAYRPEGKPMAWILTITKNLCRKKLRLRRRDEQLSEAAWETRTAEREALSPEDRLVLNECMTGLGDEERQIVILHAVAGFKHREIARLLELPLSTVLSKYSRAIKKLRQRL